MKETEHLQEILQENSFEFQKYGLQVPEQLPADADDDNGEELILEMQTLASKVQDKYETVDEKCRKAGEDVAKKQRAVSEKTAILEHNTSSLATLKTRIGRMTGDEGSVAKFQRIVGAIRQFETTMGKNCTVDGSDPQKVVSYVTSRIEEIDEDNAEEAQPEQVKTVLKRLAGLVSSWSLLVNWSIRT